LMWPSISFVRVETRLRDHGLMNMPTDLASRFSDGLRLPVMVAPMFLISGPDLVVAAGKAGVLGVYPVANARTLADLEAGLQHITAELRLVGRANQWAINLIVHPTYTRFDAEMELLERFRPRLVITALGGPRRALDRVHAFGGKVFSDVITIVHARKAIDAGADGLVLVAAGAGGHTGSYSPFAFVNEVRHFWAGPIVLGGALSNARAIRAALMLGADFAYMGYAYLREAGSACSQAARLGTLGGGRWCSGWRIVMQGTALNEGADSP
jgi:nitronate monooxygenase